MFFIVFKSSSRINTIPRQQKCVIIISWFVDNFSGVFLSTKLIHFLTLRARAWQDDFCWVIVRSNVKNLIYFIPDKCNTCHRFLKEELNCCFFDLESLNAKICENTEETALIRKDAERFREERDKVSIWFHLC